MSEQLSCDEVVREMWDWVDNELDRSRWEQIETHLATCTGCTEHVEFARGFLAKVHATPAAGDVESLRTRVRAALRSGSPDV